MEDLDTARVIPGSADRILRTLEGFGLQWDGEVLHQSRRIPLYREAMDTLETGGHTYECSCTRRELGRTPQAWGNEDTGYPGICRHGPTRPNAPTATRFRLPDGFVVFFDDQIQGRQQLTERELGDFVIRRKDGIIAYQLAVVVDDHAQHVSNVVRGTDLLNSTGWQIALHRALHLPTPSYSHLPLVVEKDAEKLGKSRRSIAVEPRDASTYLTTVLRLLNHPPPPELERDQPPQLLAWAARNWNVRAFEKLHSVTYRDTDHAK
jgi:glutamyl-Q tRNA(Asp) synthetase